MSIGMFRQRTIAKDALLAVVLLLIAQLAFGLLIVYLLSDIDSKLAGQRHRVAVVSISNRIANLTEKFGILLIFDLSKDGRNSDPDTEMWQALSVRIESEFRRLRALSSEDLPAQEILQEQEKIFRAAEAFYRKQLVHSNNTAKPSKVKVDPSSLVLSHDIYEHYQELLARYKAQRPAREILSANSLLSAKGILVGAFFVDIVFTFILLALVLSRLVNGITALALNIDRYKSNQPLVDFPSSGDELAKLDKLLRETIQALENSARYEMTLVDGASDVIFRLDSEGRIRDLNAAALGQWGYQPSELEGAPWQTIVPPESRQAMRAFLLSLPHEDHSSAFELAIKRNDGALVDSRFSGYWSEVDHSTFCFVSDIGAAKHREEELREKENDVRMLMRNLPIGLVVVDQFGAFLSTNERMEQMLNGAIGSTSGSTSASASRHVDDVFRDNDVLVQARRVGQLRTQIGNIKIGNRKADGLDCEITVVDLAGTNETLLVVEDVSEKVKLENLRKDFLQLLWRNLGEPILKVKQMVLGIEVKTEKEQTRVQKFVLNVNRLIRLLDELLRLEELAPGKLVGALVPIRASDLADSAIASLADYALNQGVKLELQMTPQVVLADFERVVQVLINLISNAIKFSFKGGTVLLQVGQDRDQVEFSVIDSGRGVPLAKQAQIFQAYGQASVSDASSGTGLGLAICQSIVEAHGGTIGVENRETGGSRFWFKLPRLEVPSE
ncbi:PAS domain S-box protein [bacterium]|nr:PAS domain S-box protein [bacterium]MBP9807567.1 PAS domain S-box protein [bacterium]